MPIQITSRFVDVGKAQINDDWLPVTITGSRTKFGPEPVKCSVLLDLSHKEAWINNLSGLSSCLTQFQGQTVDGFNVWASDFQQEGVTAYNAMIKWEGTAKQFIESNTADLNVINDEVAYSIFIPPLPLISVGSSRIPNSTSLESIDENELVSWNTAAGKARLIYGYLNLEETIGMDKAIVKVQKYEIQLKKSVPRINTIKDLLISR